MRRALVAILLLALLPSAGAQASGCSGEAPCVLQVTLTDDAIAVTPSDLASAGPYVLEASNNGTANATIRVGNLLSLGVAANGTATSTPFTFPSSGSYDVSAGNRTATVAVVIALPPTDGDEGDGGLAGSSAVLAVVLPVLVGIALVTIAALVVRHGKHHRHNLFFSALYFLSGLKSLSEGLRLKADDFNDAARLFPPGLFWELLALFCALGMLLTVFLFVSSFPRPLAWMVRAPKSGVLAFVPSLLMALLLILAVSGIAPAQAYFAAVSGFNFLFFVVTVAAILLILRTRTSSPDPIERQQSIYVLLGFMPGFIAGWAVSALQFGSSSGGLDADTAQGLIDNIIQFISPVFELLACTLVAFAILKYNILGISPGFRLGVKSALVGMMFIVLFLLTQFVENVVLQDQLFAFAGPYGSFLFSGIAGVVLFKPIEKVSNKVSDKLLPTVAGEDGLLPTEEIYHAQATYILRDAKVTDRELAGLRLLRQQLKISDARAREIEEDVERILHVDDARLGNRATGQGDAASATSLGVASREAAATAATEMHVTRGAKAPARPPAPQSAPAAPATAAAKRAAPAKPAASATKAAAAKRASPGGSAKAAGRAAGKATAPAKGKGAGAPGASGAARGRKRAT